MFRGFAAFISLIVFPTLLLAQGTNATLTGRITDPTKASIVGATVTITNADTNIHYAATTNAEGIYTASTLPPGKYKVEVEKAGFRTVVRPDVVLHVQDAVAINFDLAVGSASESITVEGGAPLVNTETAAVSTVVDHQFVENIPLNGRSFQSLLTLTPGVTLVGGNVGQSGEISVNGQRTEANNFTVDGVSANTGTVISSSTYGAGIAGAVPQETVLGTTQSLVSLDALQEFRATTSTYSAEYGRTPGGQFSLSTRSGTNEFHGSAYDYFRNEVLDANDWFNNAATPPVPRLPERQNDFGGTLGGPIEIPGLYSGKDKTFFFFSYEGLRLVIPQPVSLFFVPDASLRQQAPSALQPFLNSFPMPNGGEDGLNDGLAQYNLAYSAPSSIDSIGVRVDHNYGAALKIFGRYSDTTSGGWSYSFSPGDKASQELDVRSLTLGATQLITRHQTNELRFNITQNTVNYATTLAPLARAVPFNIDSLPGPNGSSLQALGSGLQFALIYGPGYAFFTLDHNRSSQRQYNVTDTYTLSYGSHQLTLGTDWRRLSTSIVPVVNTEYGFFLSEASVLMNTADNAGNMALSPVPVEPVFHNFSLFAQDEWKATHRLSVSGGLRWDVNPPPGNLSGPVPFTVDQVTNLASSKLAPQGTPLWKTDWHAIAPRMGFAYRLHDSPARETVVRTGFGIFYDLGNTNSGFQGTGPFLTQPGFASVPFPLSSQEMTPPPPSIAPPYSPPFGGISAYVHDLALPYTMQWNLALEQGVGSRNSVTVGYVGAAGRDLLTQFQYFPAASGNPNFAQSAGLYVTANGASSSYNALQVKYQQKLTRGLQMLATYTFAHSIDDASSNFLVYQLFPASSDFDVRHTFQSAITYDLPGSSRNTLISALSKGWGLDTRITARSALPVDVQGAQAVDPSGVRLVQYRPDLVLGQSLYVYGSSYPGGRVINFNAFQAAPPNEEGNTPRNYARGFGSWQADVALRRTFQLSERMKLEFGTEAFNLFNHPSFGAINNYWPAGSQFFGYAVAALHNSIGGLNPLYQVGGPRSLQISLKVRF